MTVDSKLQTAKNFILTEAGRCVACGLCLPHCPTYQLTQVEAESPRGRISLISALASGELEASANLESLLGHCLLCRACEKMCPSTVSFSMLMDKGRYLHNSLQKKSFGTKVIVNNLIDFIFRHPEWLRIATRLASPVKVLSRNKKLSADKHKHTERTAFDYLPSIQPHKQWENKYPVENSTKQVNLFLGCVSRSMDGETLDDAIFILNRIGYSVMIPAGQTCCGALSLHAGREKESLQMMQKNVRAFASKQNSAITTPIIYTASGCGISLASYHNYLQDNELSSQTNEVCQFIDTYWPESLHLTGRKMKVLLHTPCSMENTPANMSAPYRLLKRIDDCDVHLAISSYRCCGASGTKMLVDVKTSNALRDPVLDQIKKEKPDIVVSSNIGCALHLAEGIRHAQLDIPVKHPVSLLADIFRNNLNLRSKD